MFVGLELMGSKVVRGHHHYAHVHLGYRFDSSIYKCSVHETDDTITIDEDGLSELSFEYIGDLRLDEADVIFIKVTQRYGGIWDQGMDG